ALNSFLSYNTGLKEYKVNNSNYEVIIENSVKDVRPFTACAIVKNLKLNNENIKEIIQLQEKLHLTYGRNRKKVAIGIYPFEKIKTPIRFLALNANKIKFKPLGYNKVMTAEEILSKHEAGKAYANLLDDYDKYPLFIDANNNILSMPPIINSQGTGEVTTKTRDVFIECSGFNFDVLNKCLNIIVTSLSDMGGKIYSMKLKYGNKFFITPNLKPGEMKININNANKLLGLKLKENELKKYLERMGYCYKNKKVLVPCYRTDIMHENDLIEDIAIAYGYDNFNFELPNISTIGEEDKFEYFKSKIAEFLVGLNLLEVSSYVITNKHEQNDK
ncbi:MAG: phenylalanine--tRNA ligase subunit beta, partial [Nanoarchaeota archaeon]